MATGGLNVGGDVEQALENVGVPSYVLDATGIVRWLNPAAERLVGDVRGRHLTSVVAPEDKPGARERFAQKMLGTALASEASGHLVSSTGTRVPVEVSAVALKNGERVVGVFGLFEERPDDSTKAPPAHLTPRQVEVLRLLEQGRSTKQIAAELHLSTETVRNHIRRLFRALGVNYPTRSRRRRTGRTTRLNEATSRSRQRQRRPPRVGRHVLLRALQARARAPDALAVWWIFGEKVGAAFDGFFLPFLGLLFLPWTSTRLRPAWTDQNGVTGVDCAVVGLGLAADIIEAYSARAAKG